MSLIGSAVESFSLLDQSITHPVCSTLQMWENTKTMLMKPRFFSFHSIFFCQIKPNNSCSGCEDIHFSLVSGNTYCCRIRNAQSKSEIENKEDEIKCNSLFGPWNWMNVVITDIQTGKCGELCWNMLREKMLAGFRTLPQKTASALQTEFNSDLHT